MSRYWIISRSGMIPAAAASVVLSYGSHSYAQNSDISDILGMYCITQIEDDPVQHRLDLGNLRLECDVLAVAASYSHGYVRPLPPNYDGPYDTGFPCGHRDPGDPTYVCIGAGQAASVD